MGKTGQPTWMRLSREDEEWLNQEAEERGIPKTQLLREIVSLAHKSAVRAGNIDVQYVPGRVRDKLALLFTGIVMTVGFIASVGAQTLL